MNTKQFNALQERLSDDIVNVLTEEEGISFPGFRDINRRYNSSWRPMEIAIILMFTYDEACVLLNRTPSGVRNVYLGTGACCTDKKMRKYHLNRCRSVIDLIGWNQVYPSNSWWRVELWREF